MIICAAFIALSVHVGIGDGWNQIHPGATCEFSQWSAGAYLNSEYTGSVYASYTFENVIGAVDLEIGAVTGYSGASVAPLVRGVIDIDEKRSLFVALAYEINLEKLGLVLGLENRF